MFARSFCEEVKKKERVNAREFSKETQKKEQQEQTVCENLLCCGGATNANNCVPAPECVCVYSIGAVCALKFSFIISSLYIDCKKKHR